MKSATLCSAIAIAALAMGETISIPAGSTVKIEPGRVFNGDVLVKTGQGTLELTGAGLNNAGLEIREGTVKFVGGGATTITTRYLKWNVTKTRPANSEPPEYGNSGSQFGEFRLFRNGKMLQIPKGATAMNARPGWSEGPQQGIDGDVKTKCFYNPFIADFGEDMTFDGYSFVTANDAIGRDPNSWKIDAGVADGSAVNWVNIGVVENFEAPKERFAEAGKIFKIILSDVLPPNYPVTVCGKGCLMLEGANENLENVRGTGLIKLERASIDFSPGVKFSGSVCGSGSVTYKK